VAQQRKMTPIRIPAELLKDIDEHVGPRQRSQFLIEAAERELIRQKQLQAIRECAGAWKDADYPELPHTAEGLSEYVAKLRGEADRGETTP
jgi:metal-responsive CopG/Arc/MetJ family transcriptional regulator